jgi:hypothetical protein
VELELDALEVLPEEQGLTGGGGGICVLESAIYMI